MLFDDFRFKIGESACLEAEVRQRVWAIHAAATYYEGVTSRIVIIYEQVLRHGAGGSEKWYVVNDDGFSNVHRCVNESALCGLDEASSRIVSACEERCDRDKQRHKVPATS